MKVRFRRSRLYISVLPVIALGLSISFLGTLLGIGGGFIMVPALIYLLKVPTIGRHRHLACPDRRRDGESRR